jgi:NFACT N-terminal and middle domains
MIIESGFRCHLTHFSRTTAAAPSPFVARLRKFLRSRRVTGVFQIGTDRIIEIQFSDGQYRLFLEFYAGGNIVLTDKDYSILALLRIVSEQEELRVGSKYSLDNCQNFGGVPPLTTERLKNALEKAVGKKEDPDQGFGKKQKKNTDSLRKALAVGITEYPPMLIDHALRVSGFSNNLRPEEVLRDNELIEKLLLALNEAESVMRDITSADESKGYIIAKPRVKNVTTPSDTITTDRNQEVGHEEQSDEHGEINQFIYEDFHPFLPRQIEDDPSLKVFTFDGFNKTVDEFVCRPVKYL